MALYDQALMLLNLVSVMPANRHHETSAKPCSRSEPMEAWCNGIRSLREFTGGSIRLARKTSSPSRRAVGQKSHIYRVSTFIRRRFLRRIFSTPDYFAEEKRSRDVIARRQQAVAVIRFAVIEDLYDGGKKLALVKR